LKARVYIFFTTYTPLFESYDFFSVAQTAKYNGIYRKDYHPKKITTPQKVTCMTLIP
jgi:hypothetical protein